MFGTLHVFMCSRCVQEPAEARRVPQVSWHWGCKRLCGTARMVGPQPTRSARTVKVVDCWAMSPAPYCGISIGTHSTFPHHCFPFSIPSFQYPPPNSLFLSIPTHTEVGNRLHMWQKTWLLPFFPLLPSCSLLTAPFPLDPFLSPYIPPPPFTMHTHIHIPPYTYVYVYSAFKRKHTFLSLNFV